MKTVNENIQIIKNLGLEICGHFTLPENAWWESYYNPLKINLKKIAEKYKKEADKVIQEHYFEMDLFKKYSNEYGYEFYIVKKT